MDFLEVNALFNNRFRLVKRIGIGGYSEVWLVHDIKAGDMELAVKIFAPEKGLDEKALKVFSNEFALVFNLNHPLWY